jgi:hypothetical protein
MASGSVQVLLPPMLATATLTGAVEGDGDGDRRGGSSGGRDGENDKVGDIAAIANKTRKTEAAGM